MKNHEQPPKAVDLSIGDENDVKLPDNIVEFPTGNLPKRSKSPFEADGTVIQTVFLPQFDLEPIHNRIAERAIKMQRDASWESIRQVNFLIELENIGDNDK